MKISKYIWNIVVCMVENFEFAEIIIWSWMKLAISKLYCLICMGEFLAVVAKYGVEDSSYDELFDYCAIVHVDNGLVFKGQQNQSMKNFLMKNSYSFHSPMIMH